MSGPKTSRYVLTAEQRRRIEEKQRILRETKVAQDRQSNLQRKCSNQLTDLKLIMAELQKLCDESGYGREEFHALDKKQKEITVAMVPKASSQSLESLQKENKRLESLLSEIKELNSTGNDLVRRIASDYKKELSGVIASGFDLSFANLGSGRKIRENQFIIKINDVFKKIDGLELSLELKEKFAVLQERADAIKSVDFLENFCSMQVYPFVHECEFYRNHIDEFEELLLQYRYLLEEVGEPERCFVFSEDNIIKVKAEIERLQGIMVCQKEQEYISKAVDEVMVEMGYELVGERTVKKKSGKKFRNGLYTLEEGTAVNVTFSDSGQISMELGALDTTDRMPTESEATDLADDMRAFCTDYSALEKKLAEKGIMTSHISFLPPSIEYAQVFNTSDYKLKRTVGIYNKEKRKAAVGNQLHKEG